MLFTSDNLSQIREVNGGTASASVYKITPEAVTRIFFKGEEYGQTNYLSSPSNENLVIACNPFTRASGDINEFIYSDCCLPKGKPCKVYAAPFSVRLTKGEEKRDEDIKNVFEPDITIVCDKLKIDKQGCNGVPDLIIEIISPSSIKHDRVTKFNQYEKAGVVEYWIVEPEGKLVSVFLLQSNGRYGRPEIYTEEEKITVSIFPDLNVDLSAVFPSI